MKTLLLCFEVFFARMLDVSLGSIKTVLVVKQKGFIAAMFAFVEILIWYFVARQILTQDLSIIVVFCYAAGYASGNLIGSFISKRFINGILSAMIITDSNVQVTNKLKEDGFGVSTIKLEGNKYLLLVEFKKRSLKLLKNSVHEIDENAFIIINETLHVENGYLI